ncbi:MAG TPA: hypothetical protein VN223_03515, partial [Candidatus Elarobacter sp.]|nr:hypothetical protein [Candidatus Elarobacter sp.]
MATSSGTINKNLISLKQFLESTPPEMQAEIADLATRQNTVHGTSYVLSEPELLLNCSSEICNGDRIYRCSSSHYYPGDAWGYYFMTYKCSNCQQGMKSYALSLKRANRQEVAGSAYKFGELPIFGPPTPAKLITLIGP